MGPADGTGLLPLNFLLLGVGVWNFLRSLSGWFRSDLFPFFLNLPVINSTWGANIPQYTHV